MSGKYAPLESYFRGVSPEQSDMTLSFKQIESILHDKLPRSAHEYRPWWGNEADGMHTHAHAWMHAGWKVDAVDQRSCIVRFRRR
jgi:hypothetical protein